MSQVIRSTLDADLRGTKENLAPQGTGSNRRPSARQRLPTEKLATVRAEEAATAERREAAKARKIHRARQALEEDDDEGNQEDDLAAPTNFTSHTVAAKPVLLKSRALAKHDRQAARAQAAHEHENRGQSQARGRALAHPSRNIIDDEDEDFARAAHEQEKRGRSLARGRAVAHPNRSIIDDEYEEGDISDEASRTDLLDFGDDAPDHDMSQHITYSTHNDELDHMDDAPQNLSRGLSSTPSSGDATLKRRASSSDSLKETKIQKSSSGRPKAADYDDSDKALILSAISYYRTELGTDAAFPDIAKEAEMLGQVWQDACVHLDITSSITPQIAKLITSRGSQLRGELKSKTRPLVEGLFGFESGLNRKRVAKNREMAESLKDGKGFIYKVTDADATKRKGMYQAKILQKVVNAMWFRNKQDEGVVHAAKFNPLTISAVALVLTAIECCVDEWITGIKTDIPFSAALYKDIYEDHIRCLERFDKITKQHILPNILLKLYNRGRFHAGAQPISTAGIPTISDSAFQAALKEYEEDSETETDGENGETD